MQNKHKVQNYGLNMNMAWVGASAWMLLKPNAIQRVLYKPVSAICDICAICDNLAEARLK